MATRRTANPNKGMLKDSRCPQCGSYGPFEVTVAFEVTLTDEGVRELDAQVRWAKDSPTRCPKCKHAGILGDFADTGLVT